MVSYDPQVCVSLLKLIESDLYRREVFHYNLNYAPKPFNYSEIFYLVRYLGLSNQCV